MFYTGMPNRGASVTGIGDPIAMTTRAAIPAQDISRLTGIPLGQLASWHRSKFIRASGVYSRGYARLYSWEDYVRARAARKLQEQGMGSRAVRKAVRYLDEHVPDWPMRSLHVFGGEALVRLKEGLMKAAQGGQMAFADIVINVMDQIAKEGPLGILRRFDRYIDMNPAVMAGTPVVKGTRVAAHDVIALHQRGWDHQDIATMLGLSPEQVEQAIEFEIAA